MTLIVNISRKKTPNRGDLASAPCQYFPHLNRVIYIDILDCNNENAELTKILNLANTIIIGGGGLLGHTKFEKEINWIGEMYGYKTVIWGAGVNTVNGRFCENNIDLFKHVGIRDCITKYTWVPCASCLSPLFINIRGDHSTFPKNDKIGILENNSGKNPTTLPLHNYTKAEKFGNKKVSMHEMLNFIASCGILVSNSYHAVYWAVLLKIPVIAIPTSSKFNYFKHKICLSKAEDWPNYIDDCINYIYSNALEECVDANVKFSKEIGIA